MRPRIAFQSRPKTRLRPGRTPVRLSLRACSVHFAICPTKHQPSLTSLRARLRRVEKLRRGKLEKALKFQSRDCRILADLAFLSSVSCVSWADQPGTSK